MKHATGLGSLIWWVCIAFLCVMAGVWAGHYKWSINRFYTSLADFQRVLFKGDDGLVNKKVYLSVTYPINPKVMYSGYTILTHNDNTVLMVDKNGTEIHRWTLAYEELTGPSVTDFSGMSFTHITNVFLYPNGNLLVIFHNYNDARYGRKMAMIDKDSKIKWTLDRSVHDSMTVSEDKIYVLAQVDVTDKDKKGLDFATRPTFTDSVLVVSDQGKVVDEIPLLSAFLGTRYEQILYSHSKDGQRYIRAVSIERLTKDIADAFPSFNEGDLLISFKNLHAIAVVDPKTKKVKWAKRSIWRYPDDAIFTPQGSILVYDSNGLNEDMHLKTARIVEINPADFGLYGVLNLPDEHQIDDGLQGSIQYLPNKNVLVSIANQGQVYEISPDGNIVWKHQRHNMIYNAQRVPLDYIQGGWDYD